MSWGDLDENGKPISRDKGRLYTNWVDNVKAYGYKFDHRILNAADYGAYTSRKRFFGIFAKPYLPIATECGQLAIEIYETDSGPMRKIKEFMALYGIVDIKMRMLKIIELKRIMGFPENYTLIGTQADQKKFIGNAVEVNIARVLCEALVEEIVDELLKVA